MLLKRYSSVVRLFGASSKYFDNCICISYDRLLLEFCIPRENQIDYTFMFVVKAENIPSPAMTFTLGIHWNASPSMEICHGFIPRRRQMILCTARKTGWHICRKYFHFRQICHGFIVPPNYIKHSLVIQEKQCLGWCVKLDARGKGGSIEVDVYINHCDNMGLLLLHSHGMAL